ncbi:hypothetical protein [Proteus myxofaciens]|uniref:Uncharacterized protein n=1 Tax=Proteus myxofaciens ATCC 19692 TaxID=1354337 RepID=A0A198GF96_9GAMM|nr:hypothetical protein [Proteus myxofaciens]OAT34886.1 hypothetical protein M983_0849 [Proteus myxofaciens ATCC 19692]
MTEEQYKTYAQVIVVGREYISFNHNTISAVTGLTPARVGTILRKLLAFKCVEHVETKSRKRTRPINNYAVTDDAITRLRSQFEKERLANLPLFPKAKKVEEKKPRKIMNDFLCGPVFVKKANTAGMGNPMLMKLDSLLSGVRV